MTTATDAQSSMTATDALRELERNADALLHGKIQYDEFICLQRALWARIENADLAQAVLKVWRSRREAP